MPLKPRTVQSLKRLLEELKATTLSAGRYPPPFTAKAYDRRNKQVAFRSLAYVSLVIEIAALENAIETLTFPVKPAILEP